MQLKEETVWVVVGTFQALGTDGKTYAVMVREKRWRRQFLDLSWSNWVVQATKMQLERDGRDVVHVGNSDKLQVGQHRCISPESKHAGRGRQRHIER